jgi:hypothetical protein
MTARRKRSDPQATRYRIAVAALARAEKRKAAAEKAIKELSAKVRGYERRLTPERKAEIATGTKTAAAKAAEIRERWKQAERALLVAAKVGAPDLEPRISIYRTGKRKMGLWVRMPEWRALIWHVTRGFLVASRRAGTTPELYDLRKPDDTQGDTLAFCMEEAA